MRARRMRQVATDIAGAVCLAIVIAVALAGLVAFLGAGGCATAPRGERYPIDYPLVDPVTTQTWDHIVNEVRR